MVVTVTVFSYAGGVTFGFGTDPAVVPDADALVTALEEELTDAQRVSGAGRSREAGSPPAPPSPGDA